MSANESLPASLAPASLSIDARLVAESEAVLRKHARSFRWAAPFLPRDARRDAAVTYAFCRYIDDVVDERQSDKEALDELANLANELRGDSQARPLVAAYQEIARRRGIPESAALDLLAGMQFDMNRVRVQDDAELALYCYRVAGVVGLMMAPILGTVEPSALRHAVDLGIGMQLTNISRDVGEDARRNRVYLPASRLERAGTSSDAIVSEDAAPAAVHHVVCTLLDDAEIYYASGKQGLRYLPFRARVAIAIAAKLYRAIGHRVRGLRELSLRKRAVVSPWRKIVWVGIALIETAGSRRQSELPKAPLPLPAQIADIDRVRKHAAQPKLQRATG